MDKLTESIMTGIAAARAIQAEYENTEMAGLAFAIESLSWTMLDHIEAAMSAEEDN